MTMTLISTVNAATTSITFSSIPQTYTDLMLIVSTRGASGNVFETSLRFNGDATSGRYASRLVFATSSSVASEGRGDNTRTWVIQTVGGADVANTFSNSTIYIPDYASSRTKSVSSESVAPNNNASSQRIQFAAGSYNQGTAITQITFTNDSLNFNGSSTASLYGILKGSGGATTSP